MLFFCLLCSGTYHVAKQAFICKASSILFLMFCLLCDSKMTLTEFVYQIIVIFIACFTDNQFMIELEQILKLQLSNSCLLLSEIYERSLINLSKHSLRMEMFTLRHSLLLKLRKLKVFCLYPYVRSPYVRISEKPALDQRSNCYFLVFLN